MSFTLEQVSAMKEVYFDRDDVESLIENGYDFHQEFADRVGLSRQEAKGLFHEINYRFRLGYSKFFS